MSFSVRLGAAVPLLEGTSGRLLLALQPPEIRVAWLLEAEPWVDQATMGFYPEIFRMEGAETRITNLLVMDGELYCGIADAADPMDACRVFRWTGGQEWMDCGRLGDDPRHLSVQGMVVHGREHRGASSCSPNGCEPGIHR